MDNKTLTAQELLNILTVALNAQGSDTTQNQSVSGEGYINKTAAALLCKYSEQDVESLRYNNGDRIEKTFIDDIRATLGNFNRSDYVTGRNAEVLLDAVFNNSDFYKNFTIKYGDELTIPIDLMAYAKRQLTSTERLGRQLNDGEKSALAAISGIEMFLKPVELQYDIKMSTIRNYMYDPKFEEKVLIKPMIEVLAEDLLDLATNGISDAFSTVNNTFPYLAVGHEYMLKNLNGSWTNTNGAAIVVGKFGNYHTPNRVKLQTYITKTSYTGFDIINAMNVMYKMLPAQFRTRPDLRWVLAQDDADLYAEAKSSPIASSVGINVESREKLTNDGGMPKHRGIQVAVNPKKVSIADDGNLYLGCLKELYVGAQKKVVTTREFKSRMSTGGSGIENTKELVIDYQVGLRNAFVICTPDAAVEKVTMIKSIVSGVIVYTDKQDNKGDEYVSASASQSIVTGVTVYCDTPGALIYGSIDSSFDDGTKLPVGALPTVAGTVAKYTAGDLITLTTGQYLSLRAYRVVGGALVAVPSAITTIRYTA